jgi:hypothetical protein
MSIDSSNWDPLVIGQFNLDSLLNDTIPSFWEKEMLWFINLISQSGIVAISINTRNNFDITSWDTIQSALDEIMDKFNLPIDNNFHFILGESQIIDFISNFYTKKENISKQLYIKPILHQPDRKNWSSPYSYQVLVVESIQAWYISGALATVDHTRSSLLPLIVPWEESEFQWEYKWRLH